MSIERTTIQKCILEVAGELLQMPVENIGIDDPLSLYDFDSIKTISLMSEVEDRLEFDLDLMLLIECQTVNELTNTIVKILK